MRPLELRSDSSDKHWLEATMTRRTLRVLAAVAALFTMATWTSGTIEGQGAGTPALVVTAFGGQPTDYRAPRTPWGDPDLQGVWSSDDMSNIPMSRAERFGNRLYLTDQEFAERTTQIQRGVQQSENNADSTFRFDFARRAFRQTSLIVDPSDGRTPAVKPGVRTMPRGTFGNGPLDWVTDFSLYERCITRGIAGSVLRVIYGNGNRIVQAPGVVAMSYEMLHDTRLFYLDGRAHVGSPLRMYLGDSRARWDGEDLVVETTNLTSHTAVGVNGGGPRHSEQMKLTERFRRVADNILQYQMTFDDPLTYERPFTLSPLDGGRLLPYECHEGNTAISQALSAERYEDRALAEDLARGIKRERRAVQDGAGVGATLPGGRGRGAAPAPGAAADGPARGAGPARPPEGDQER
jgi:hypothetical protein